MRVFHAAAALIVAIAAAGGIQASVGGASPSGMLKHGGDGSQLGVDRSYALPKAHDNAIRLAQLLPERRSPRSHDR